MIANGVLLNTRIAVRRAAIRADAVAIERTPVDTGRAQGNWIVSVGNPDTTVYEEGQANAASALSQAASVIQNWKSGTIFISNSLPYIGRLEDGYSAQAPNGMVTDAYNAAREELAKARLVRL